jgi:signal transduction histidine kinase
VDLTVIPTALGALVLEQLADGRFARRGAAPTWCALLVSSALGGDLPFALAEVFPFLSAFLPDAEACWQVTPPAPAYSGFWTEVGLAGEALHLEAAAMRADARPVLIVRRNERLFAQQELLLQRARELRLTYDALTREIEQKDVLIHSIVHDLAAPLHGILGALSLLSELPLGEQAAKWTAIGLAAANRQRELIREILEVFSAELAVQTRLPDPGTGPDLASAIAEAVSQAEPAARVRGVQLVAKLDPGPWRVIAERSRLLRVLANLIHNALRHSPSGGRVTVSARRDERGAQVDVEDEGPGVAPELLPHLFERVVGGRVGVDGTGLGLYFCRITTERWGGGIGYERQGVGSRFWLRLVLAEKGRARG